MKRHFKVENSPLRKVIILFRLKDSNNSNFSSLFVKNTKKERGQNHSRSKKFHSQHKLFPHTCMQLKPRLPSTFTCLPFPLLSFVQTPKKVYKKPTFSNHKKSLSPKKLKTNQTLSTTSPPKCSLLPKTSPHKSHNPHPIPL